MKNIIANIGGAAMAGPQHDARVQRLQGQSLGVGVAITVVQHNDQRRV